MKSAIAAAQMLEAAAFDTSQRAIRAADGVPIERQGRGIAEQLALARRQSPWHARRWLGRAKVLTRELPGTLAELAAGRTTEWRALLMACETIWLSREDRGEVDSLLGPLLHGLSDARVEADAKKHAYRLDPDAFVERRRVASGQRRVTLRPRPDVMSALSATVPVEQGVAMWATMRRDADARIGFGDNDGRTRDQLMADLLIERVTGRSSADSVAVEVEVVIDVDTLLGTRGSAHAEPAQLTAEGIAPVPIPAETARCLIAGAPQAWLRRCSPGPTPANSSPQRLAVGCSPRPNDGSFATEISTAPRRTAAQRSGTPTTPTRSRPTAHLAGQRQRQVRRLQLRQASSRLDADRYPHRPRHTHHPHRAPLPRHPAPITRHRAAT